LAISGTERLGIRMDIEESLHFKLSCVANGLKATVNKPVGRKLQQEK
jgi:hypothetical protein